MANKVYQHDEATIWFVPAAAAQAEDAAFEVDNLGAGSGRQSAQYDFTASARAHRFAWRAFIQMATTPVIGETIDVYLKTSDGTHADNNDGISEGALTGDDKLRNLHFLGSIVVDEAAADKDTVASGIVKIGARYVQVVFKNATADALTDDVDENGFSLTPIPPEVQ